MKNIAAETGSDTFEKVQNIENQRLLFILVKLKMKNSLILIVFIFGSLTSFKSEDCKNMQHNVVFVNNKIELSVLERDFEIPKELPCSKKIPHCSVVAYQWNLNIDSLISRGIYFEKKFLEENEKEIENGNPVLIMKYSGYKLSDGDNIDTKILRKNDTRNISSFFDENNVLYRISETGENIQIIENSEIIEKDTVLVFDYQINIGEVKIKIKETHNIKLLSEIERKNVFFETYCL